VIALPATSKQGEGRCLAGVFLSVPFVLAASHVFFLGLAVQVTVGFRLLIDASRALSIIVPCETTGSCAGGSPTGSSYPSSIPQR
jgi:hypothetical protein